MDAVVVAVVAVVDTQENQTEAVADVDYAAATKGAPNVERAVAVAATAERACGVDRPLLAGVFVQPLAVPPFCAFPLRLPVVAARLLVFVCTLLAHDGRFLLAVDAAAPPVALLNGVSFLPLHGFDVRAPSADVLPPRFVFVTPLVATARVPP